MKHVVLTRFNVQLLEDLPPPDEDWMHTRLPLFERFTAASMAGQTVRPDAWIVFCDDGSPSWLLERLRRVATVWRVGGMFTPVHAAEAIGPVDEPLITTRLDCDDAIAVDFMERVQREAAGAEFINFPRGLHFAVATRKLYRWSHPSNPFISRVSSSAAETIMHAGKHPSISSRFEVRQVESEPMWLSVIHDQAQVNTQAAGRRTSGDVLRRFSIDARAVDQGIRREQVGWLARRSILAARRRLSGRLEPA